MQRTQTEIDSSLQMPSLLPSSFVTPELKDKDNLPCTDLILFKSILNRSRRLNDTIASTNLSNQIQSKSQCTQLLEFPRNGHQQRLNAINSCLQQLKSQADSHGIHPKKPLIRPDVEDRSEVAVVQQNDPFLQRQMELLKGELIIEDIVHEQALTKIEAHCRFL